MQEIWPFLHEMIKYHGCLTQDLNAEAHYHDLHNALPAEPWRLPNGSVFLYVSDRYFEKLTTL